MDRDERITLAVQLVAPSMAERLLGTPDNAPEISMTIRIAYNAIFDAELHIPPEGKADITSHQKV